MADWLDAMYPIAIGELGLTADAFEALTPRELQLKYDAAIAQERRALERMAQLAAWVMSPWLKEPVTAADLMGGSRGATSPVYPWQESR